MDKSLLIGFRATMEDIDRLDKLARAMDRSRSSVLRLLIRGDLEPRRASKSRICAKKEKIECSQQG